MSRPRSATVATAPSPERSRVLVDVLKELAIQRNLIADLLREEASSNGSRTATSPARTHAATVSVSPPRRHLISPTPDRDDGSRSADNLASSPLLSPMRTSQEAGVGPAPADPAIANLVEALSTSSWSSDEAREDSVYFDGGRTSADADTRPAPTANLSTSPPPQQRGWESGVVARNRFYIAALQTVEAEYDQRQSIVLEEVIAFTEVSSAFLSTTIAPWGRPQRL